MLLIALIAVAAAWVAVIAMVVGLCMSAARGDRQLRARREVSLGTLHRRRRFSPLATR
jgi:hypothetical protein